VRFYGLLFDEEANQKVRKAIDDVPVILNKIHLSLFTASLWNLFPLLIPSI